LKPSRSLWDPRQCAQRQIRSVCREKRIRWFVSNHPF